MTDILMTGIDGIEFVQILRKRDPDVKVAIISGATEHQVSNSKILSMGEVVFIEKPFDKKKVKEFLTKVG